MICGTYLQRIKEEVGSIAVLSWVNGTRLHVRESVHVSIDDDFIMKNVQKKGYFSTKKKGTDT